MNVRELQEEAHETAISKGWTDNRNIGELIALMHSELSEALEEWRTGRPVDEIYFNGNKPEGFVIELADTFIRILNACGALGLDLEAATIMKLSYNKTREFKHGGKIA